MNTLIKHIEYLISRKDCVIVPGLGAILAQHKSAEIDAEAEIVVPPRRVFSFNIDLNHNDGMLACSISRAQGISYESAVERVAERVEAMTRQLHTQGEVPLGRIGRLGYDAESGTTTFVPYDADRLSVGTAWLPRVEKRRASIAAPAEQPQMRVRPYSPLARFARIAASIAVLICICFIASTPVAVDDAALASFMPELKQPTVEALLPAGDNVAIVATSSRPQGYSIDTTVPVQPSAAQGRYVLVVASFATAADAARFIDQHPTLTLGTMESAGRCRVYCAAFDTEAEAYQGLGDVPSAFAGAWVCKR